MRADPDAAPATAGRPAGRGRAVAVGVALAVAAAVAAWWWLQGDAPDAHAPEPTAATAPPTVAAAPQMADAAAASAPEPASAAGSAATPIEPGPKGFVAALTDLLGREAVLTLLQTDDFARRIVATVDNLPRRHVAPRLWPVVPAPGRFAVDGSGRIAPANAARYDAIVRMVTSVPPAEAAALYRGLRPQLQKAYEDLGYPGQDFHARLVEVIDHLLQTPPAAPAMAVTLTEVKGSVEPLRPWVRYEFADPALQSLSAGQRILLRVGPTHQAALAAWMKRFLTQIARR